jgi:hypothetical protein
LLLVLISQSSFAGSIISDSIEVRDGLHTTVYNRIEPPVLKPWAPERGGKTEPQTVIMPQEWTTEEEPTGEVRTVMLIGHACAGERGLSKVWLWTEEGELRLQSTMDVRLLALMSGFESGGVWYGCSFSAEPVGEGFAPAASSAQERARFEILPTPGASAPDAQLAVLRALHACYDAQRGQLLRQFEANERLAADAARESAKPPRPTTTIVNFFPIRQ